MADNARHQGVFLGAVQDHSTVRRLSSKWKIAKKANFRMADIHDLSRQSSERCSLPENARLISAVDRIGAR